MAVVLLTGAASGIGRATARRLAAQGERCVLVDRDEAALGSLLAELPGDHLARTVDLLDAAQIAALPEGLPPLDAVINNAGMTDSSNRDVVDQRPQDWQRVLDLNLHAPVRVLQALDEKLVPGARVVNVASGAGLRAIPWRGAYSPSKAGVIAMTQAWARARPDLTMTVLCPGFVRTELVEGLMASGRLDPARAVAKIPLGRLAEPDEMAQAMAFLAGADARFLHGQRVSVDGGSSVFGGSQAYPPALAAVSDAVLDARVLQSAPGGRLDAVLAAARDAASSLTVLLPRETVVDWEVAGDAAAARMLIATLACEWGPAGRRINAVEVAANADLAAMQPLFRFVAQAHYLTGQTLCTA